jgi:hypothetical protein
MAQYGHTFQTPRQANQRPFARDLLQAAQQELAKPHDRLDDAEHRFYGLLAQRIGLPPCSGLEFVRHLLQRWGVVAQWRWLGETLAPARVMVFPCHSHERIDIGGFAGRDVALAAIAGVNQ